MTQPPLRTVLVGLGRVGIGYAEDPVMARWIPYATHAQVLAEHPAFEWGAVADPSEAARRRASERWEVQVATACAEAVAERYAPEVAVIATPPGTRSEIVEALPTLRAVMVEKPLGRTRAEAEDFLALCAARSIVVQVNLWRRGDEQFRALAGWRLEDEVGPPQAVFGVYGNGLVNNGTHLVDFVRMLIGEFDEVQALPVGARPSAGPIPGDREIAFSARLAGDIPLAVAPLDFGHYREIGLDVWGERGRLEILQEGLTVSIYPREANRSASEEHEIASDQPRLLRSTIGHAFYHLYTNLADVVNAGSELWSPGASALRAERVTEAVRESLVHGGRPVNCGPGEAP